MKEPNILIIMCDQLRADVLGCYGNQFVQTPNIDKIAKNGVTFLQAYSQTPVCVPARYGLMCGKAPFQLGLTDNMQVPTVLEKPLPQMLKQQNYYTCAIGKMHFSPVRSHFGFDRMFLSEEVPGHLHDDDYLLYLQQQGYSHIIEPHGKRSENYYVPQISALPEHIHTTAWTADTTCEVIRQNHNRPFFIFSSFIKPHPPFDPCEPYDQMYPLDQVPMPIRKEHEMEPIDFSIDLQNDYKVNGIQHMTDQEVLKIRSYYYGIVSQIDKQIGKILDTLEEQNVMDNTLILFTSDHGEMLGDHYAFGKRTYYESSTKIPMILSWPNVIPAGETRNQFVVLQDIYATAICATGGHADLHSLCQNLIPAACDSSAYLRDDIIAEFGKGRALKFMVRWDNYKYVYHSNGGIETLFDLEKDPNEFKDISKDLPELCNQCKNKLISYYKKHQFNEALNLEQTELVKYDYKKHVNTGFLYQYPRWHQLQKNENTK